jgi:sulfatase modifying factor 1
MVLRDAANHKNDKSKRRSDFILRDTVTVYPDTLVWLSDFSYAANEPMVEAYFSHPAFRNYPVVGVTWRQARAFTPYGVPVIMKPIKIHDIYLRVPITFAYRRRI